MTSAPDKLVSELRKSIVPSPFDGGGERFFVPASDIDRLTTVEEIKLFLGHGRPQGLAEYLSRHAKKLFLLIFRCLCREDHQRVVKTLQSLQEYGFTDQILPVKEKELPIKRKSPLLEHRVNWPHKDSPLHDSFHWDDFLHHQWQFMAPNFRVNAEEYQFPHFRVGQYEYNLPGNCPMPVVDKTMKELQGYFSVVCKVKLHNAHCQPGSEEVAIKQITLHGTDDKVSQDEAWAKEARSLLEIQSLKHKHIIQCLATIRHGDRRYFMFPWANGHNLRDFWEATPNQMPTHSVVKHAVEQLYQLADALYCLHNFNPQNQKSQTPKLQETSQTKKITVDDGVTPVRHGDLKPENILRFISTPNDLGILKIADMGLAKRHVQTTDKRIHATTTAYGTIMYEPPEAHNSPANAPRSRLYDIWSMGCVVFEYIIWILHGNDELKKFFNQMNSAHKQGICQYFEIVEGSPPTVHSTVLRWMNCIEDKCSRVPALRDLLKVVRTQLLVVALPSPKSAKHLRTGDRKVAGRCRATAQEFRDSLKRILDDIDRVSWYVPMSKPPAFVQAGPNISKDSKAVFKNEINQFTRRDYTVPQTDWQFPVDNEFAENTCVQLCIDASFQMPMTTARLCKRCNQLNFFENFFLLEIIVREVQDQDKYCDFCKMLANIIANNFKGTGLEVPNQLQFTRKNSGLMLDGYVKTPVGTIFRSRGLQTPAEIPIQLGFPRPPPLRTELYYKLLNLWLKDCVDNHPNCKGPKRNFMPTRLVDVGTPEAPRLRLVETTEDKIVGNYIAVSHQWGKASEHPPFFTTRQSKCSFRTEIPQHDLPATVRDAIEVTRQLGVQYFWIDTLCILQGEGGDFSSEAPRMGDVYNCAYCVLATSRTNGQHDPFLEEQPREAACVMFQRDKEEPFYICESFDDFAGDVLESNHAKRGWVLQERALARRTIFFAKNQTYFECGQGVRCQTLTKMHNHMADFLGDPNFPDKAMKSERGVKIRYFQDLYMKYSRLQFSEIADRPFAIAGIESRLRKAYKAKGGWGILDGGAGTSLFHRSLLWRRGSDEPLDPGMTCFAMPADRIAKVPSWSWMGRRGGIEYLDPPFDETEWVKDIDTPWTAQKAISQGSKDASTTPRSGTNTMELVATVRDYDVKGRRPGEVDIIFDADEPLRLSGGAIRPRCLVVGKAANGSKQMDESRVHYVLLVVPNSRPSEKAGRITYRRVGAATMLGKFISEKGERVQIQ